MGDKIVKALTNRIGTRRLLATAIATAASGMAWADGQVTGQLVSDNTGAPLEGAQVRIEQLNLNAVTGRDGRFYLRDVEAGAYVLEINYLGSNVQREQIRVEDDQTLVRNLRLSDGAIETLVIRGQAGSLNKSLNLQRTADNIVSAVSSNAIGQFPDTNVSEALQRLPGLSIERDQGEGRYVRIRGMGPDYNSVTVNGVSLPSPDSGRRAVALDVIPSDLLETLVVSKTVTPDMDANALGGSIDIRSLSAFDREEAFYRVTAEGSYNDLTEETSPKFAVTGSNQFSIGEGKDNFGVALGGSWHERSFGSHNVETGGAWDFDDGAALEEAEQRLYRITRERSGMTLNLDYKPSDNTDLYWRTLYSEFTDSEIRLANVLEFEEATAEGAAGAVEVERELKDREETQEILSTSLGGSTRFDQWTLDYQVALSESSENEPVHIAGAVFASSDAFENVGFASARTPLFDAPESFYAPSAYELDEVEVARSGTEDESESFRLDLTRDGRLGENPVQFKFGVKHMDRTKTDDVTIWVYEDFEDAGVAGDALLLSGYSEGELEYNLGRLGPHIETAPVWSTIAPLTAEDYFEEEDSRIEDFEIQEAVSAAYLMGRIDMGNLRLLGGVRYEDTDFEASGSRLTDGEFSDTNAQNEYDHVLPSLQMRYLLSDKTQVRAAWTNTLVRPIFEQLAPNYIIDEDEAEFGNPVLEPLESSNIDVGIEHYMGYASMVSAYVFYKDVDHFIYQTDLAGQGEYADFDEAVTFANGDTAELRGLELAFTKRFNELPVPFNGFLVAANGTYTDSDATLSYLDDGERAQRDTVLPSQSEWTGNFSLGYEADQFSVRMAANYKSEYLLEVTDPSDERYDVFVDEQVQLDLSARYFITEGIQLVFEAVNLTDEPYYAYVNQPAYNAQYEEYGMTWKLGLNITNF